MNVRSVKKSGPSFRPVEEILAQETCVESVFSQNAHDCADLDPRYPFFSGPPRTSILRLFDGLTANVTVAINMAQIRIRIAQSAIELWRALITRQRETRRNVTNH